MGLTQVYTQEGLGESRALGSTCKVYAPSPTVAFQLGFHYHTPTELGVYPQGLWQRTRLGKLPHQAPKPLLGCWSGTP
jgi:hypothetical protein